MWLNIVCLLVFHSPDEASRFIDARRQALEQAVLLLAPRRAGPRDSVATHNHDWGRPTVRERERTISWWYDPALHGPQSKAEDAVGKRRADLLLEHLGLFQDSSLHALMVPRVSDRRGRHDRGRTWRKTRGTVGARGRHDVSVVAAQAHGAATALARLLLVHRDAVSRHVERCELLADGHGERNGASWGVSSSLLNVR